MTTMTQHAPSGVPAMRASPFASVESLIHRLSTVFAAEGDAVRVTGFPVKVFCFRHPDQVAAILRDRNVGERKYPELLPRVKWVMGQGGYILEGGPSSPWRQRRGQVQPAFKAPCLREYADMVPAITDRMVDRWLQSAQRDISVDVFEDLRSLVTELNFRIFFSEELTGERLTKIGDATHFVDLNFVRRYPLWLPHPKNLRFRAEVRYLRGVMMELIAQRRLSAEPPQDLLTLLLSLVDPATGRQWTDEEIVGEMFSVYFGASVMSTTLTWCLYLLSQHPSVQNALVAQVRDVAPDSLPSTADLARLPLFDTVLQETLRLYPPSWGFPRYCEENFEVGDHVVPAGSLVIAMVYHSHRHPQFWSDPEAFRPERFDRGEHVERFAHYPFGIGLRTCLGANLAPLVMRLVLAPVFRRCRLEFVPGKTAAPIADFGFEIHPRDPVHMAIKPVNAHDPASHD